MTHHGEGLFRLTKNKELVEGLKSDYRSSGVDEMDLAMLRYAEKVTLEHCNCTENDVVELRGFGFGDKDILDIVQVAAYYNFVNRMSCGLGVELESYWDE